MHETERCAASPGVRQENSPAAAASLGSKDAISAARKSEGIGRTFLEETETEMMCMHVREGGCTNSWMKKSGGVRPANLASKTDGVIIFL